jgi:plasmid stabilization system protein ParE
MFHHAARMAGPDGAAVRVGYADAKTVPPANMPQGSKAAYTDKQKRQAEHIEESYRERGVSKKTAEARAWATVNKQDGGGKKKRSRAKRPRKTARRKKTAA